MRGEFVKLKPYPTQLTDNSYLQNWLTSFCKILIA